LSNVISTLQNKVWNLFNALGVSHLVCPPRSIIQMLNPPLRATCISRIVMRVKTRKKHDIGHLKFFMM